MKTDLNLIFVMFFFTEGKSRPDPVSSGGRGQAEVKAGMGQFPNALYTDPKMAAMGLLSGQLPGVSPYLSGSLAAYAGVAGGKLQSPLADPKMSSILARKIAEKPVSLQTPGPEGLFVDIQNARWLYGKLYDFCIS